MLARMTRREHGDPVLLEGGRVFTGDRRRPWTDAVAFDEIGILAVGTRDEVRAALAAPTAIDVAGRTVVPGFIDAHNHFLATGESLGSIDVRYPHVASVGDLIRAIAGAAASTVPGETIHAFGFDHAKYERPPTRWDLDAATREHPVVVYHVSGHHALVNSVTLERRGLRQDTADPPGGQLVRDERGRLTGLCLDAAMGLVLPVAVDVGNHGPNFHTEAPIEQLVDAVERAGRAFLSAGLTTVCDAQVTRRELTAYRAARDAGRLPLRTVAMPLSHQLDEYHSIGLAGPLGDDRLRIGAMKFYADGSLIGGTAAFSEPYGRSGELTGSLYWGAEDLASMIDRAHRDGWQVGVHVQGDRAMQIVLDAIESAVKAVPREHRHRLEHAGFPTPGQIARIAALGVVTVNQPRYLFDSGDEFLERLGDRAERLVPLRDELEAGVVVVLSSDSDVTSYRPMDTIASAVERRTRSGGPIGAQQSLTVEEALFAHTIDAAYALFLDDRIGSLEPGKLADVVVLDADLQALPADALSSVEVHRTFLDGVPVHEATPDG
jgi:predicted amidohydrolase YtcJ